MNLFPVKYLHMRMKKIDPTYTDSSLEKDILTFIEQGESKMISPESGIFMQEFPKRVAKVLRNKIFVSLDLETLSTRMNARIISIGAVAFKLGDPVIGERIFDCKLDTLHPDSRYHKDLDTLEWWGEQNEEVKQIAFSGSTPVYVALVKFREWFPKEAIIIGNGANFDVSILQTAYDIESIPVPWNYKNVMCLRTLKQLTPHISPPLLLETQKHTARHDAIAQAIHFTNIVTALNPLY